jgi:hypothetical protein
MLVGWVKRRPADLGLMWLAASDGQGDRGKAMSIWSSG